VPEASGSAAKSTFVEAPSGTMLTRDAPEISGATGSQSARRTASPASRVRRASEVSPAASLADRVTRAFQRATRSSIAPASPSATTRARIPGPPTNAA
jgi:hypothetical protein